MDDCQKAEWDGEEPLTWLEKRRQDRPLILHPKPSRAFGDTDDRALLRDVAFNKHSVNDGHHVSPTDNGMNQIGVDGIKVALAQGIDVEQLKKTLTMATRATIGLDMTATLPGEYEACHQYQGCTIHAEHRVVGGGYMEGQVPMEDWEEMLKGGLQTALETQTIVLAVGGVSRTCTHQLVRSRKAAFHQQSQRASYMGDCPEVRMPESVWRNQRARNAFFKATIECWNAYRVACEEDISYQDARYVLQEGTTNFILLEYTIREFLNVFAYRGCSMFSWEIVHVMREARRVLLEQYPWLEPYIKISCEKVQRCTFQGWESPEGQCDFPWATDESRTFKPEFHQIGRRTGKESV